MIKNDCTLCSMLQDGWESGDPGDPYTIILKLRVVKQDRGGLPYLYRCPLCSTWFYRRTTQEWDSYQERMLDIEKISPLDEKAAQEMIDPKPPDPPVWIIKTPGRCSKCGSGNIEILRETMVGSEVLVWERCLNCGNEEFMDVIDEDEYEG
jgi:hypothetical protein